jgi:hypothetical protein
MAERRFAALAQLRRRAEEPITPQSEVKGEAAPASEPPAAAVPPLVVTPRPMGRPPGKRSDPDWKPRTILMRTKTHRQVSRVLLDRDEGPDLSELVDELLSEWLGRQ